MKNTYFSNRQYVIIGVFLLAGIIFIFRLFYIQVIDKSYSLSANNNVLRYVTQYPGRGLIYDRKGRLLVYNEAVYDLMVTPNQVKNIDTMELCRLIGIDYDGFLERIEKARVYSPYKASPFEKQISKETYGYLEEKLYKFQGFYVQPRTMPFCPAISMAMPFTFPSSFSKISFRNCSASLKFLVSEKTFIARSPHSSPIAKAGRAPS